MSTALADQEVGFGFRRLRDLSEPEIGAPKIVYRTSNCGEEPVYTRRYNSARVGEVLARYGVYTGGLPQWSSR